VENICTYKQHVFIYVPKTGEMRGGSWVLVDSKINSDEIEMYVEEMTKGGIIEP